MLRQIPASRAWLLLGVGLALLLFLTTLQTSVNGSPSAYTMDTGEIQNALPRWGTIHWPGYPQYCLTGSVLVNLFRLLGIQPAAGASLVSALWGGLAVGLLIRLAYEAGASGPAALAGGLVLASSTSFWLDASLAEVHTLTMVFTLAILWLALRFGRAGRRSDLLWLAFVLSQGVIHQRSLLLLAPAVLVMLAPRWRSLVGDWVSLGLVSSLAPLSYVYIWLRTWMGADWLFSRALGEPRNFWEMLLDNQPGRVVALPADLGGWWDRLNLFLELLADDVPLPLAGLGLWALWGLARSRREAVGLTLAWLPSVGLCLVIWEGYVSDALLAAKLPVLAMIGLGLALALNWVWRRLAGLRRARQLGALGLVGLFVGLGGLGLRNYPSVIAVSHNSNAESWIVTAERLVPLLDEDSPPLLTLWGNQYWALIYAQAYQGRLPGLKIVHHNMDLERLFESHKRLWSPDLTLDRFSSLHWQRRVDSRLFLSSVAPGVVQMAAEPQTDLSDRPAEPLLDLENGLYIADARLSPYADSDWLLQVVWQVGTPTDRDYEVVLQLVARDPPLRADDFWALMYSPHPLRGWYPTSRWVAGELVVDHYLIKVPPGARPAAVRVALRRPYPYLETTPWLSLPVPQDSGS